MEMGITPSTKVKVLLVTFLTGSFFTMVRYCINTLRSCSTYGRVELNLKLKVVIGNIFCKCWVVHTVVFSLHIKNKKKNFWMIKYKLALLFHRVWPLPWCSQVCQWWGRGFRPAHRPSHWSGHWAPSCHLWLLSLLSLQTGMESIHYSFYRFHALTCNYEWLKTIGTSWT